MFNVQSTSSAPSRQRHRRLAQKERDRQRAARHQAAQAGETPVTSTLHWRPPQSPDTSGYIQSPLTTCLPITEPHDGRIPTMQL